MVYLSAKGAPGKFEVLTAGETEGDLDPGIWASGLTMS